MAIIRTHYAFAQVPIDRSTSGRIIDSHALAGYCRLWSRWRKADDFITKHGDTYPL